MKETLLQTAGDNGHRMVPISPNQWECVRCAAVVRSILARPGADSWEASGINVVCRGSRSRGEDLPVG